MSIDVWQCKTQWAVWIRTATWNKIYYFNKEHTAQEFIRLVGGK